MDSGIRVQPLDEALRTEVEKIISRHSTELAPIHPGVAPVLTPIAGTRALLFDVYGTLFVSGSGDVGSAQREDRAGCVASALEEIAGVGIGAEIAESISAEFYGTIEEDHRKARLRGIEFPEVDIRSVWQRVLATRNATSGAGIESWRLATLMSVAYEVRVNPVWPMVHASDTLSLLRARGTRIGIVSNAQFFTPLLFEPLLGQSLRELGISRDLTVWSYELGEAKPSVGVFQPLLHQLRRTEGISPREVVYVGNDMLNDVWTAQQCGCRTVLFAGDRRSLRMRKNLAQCRDLVPDARITDIAQLVQVLPDLGG